MKVDLKSVIFMKIYTLQALIIILMPVNTGQLLNQWFIDLKIQMDTLTNGLELKQYNINHHKHMSQPV